MSGNEMIGKGKEKADNPFDVVDVSAGHFQTDEEPMTEFGTPTRCTPQLRQLETEGGSGSLSRFTVTFRSIGDSKVMAGDGGQFSTASAGPRDFGRS